MRHCYVQETDNFKDNLSIKSDIGCRDIELQAEMVIFWGNWFLYHYGKCIEKFNNMNR